MDITVVVLTYNSAATLRACLDSLVAQEHQPAEVLIVDDDSTDASRELAGGYLGRLPIRILRNGSHNISRGRNLGIAAAGHPVVAFLDSDAWAEPGWTAAVLAAFAADTGAAVVGGAVLADHAGQLAAAIAVNDDTVRRIAASGNLLVGGCNMAVHTGRTSELFDERWVHAEDIEFTGRVGRWSVAPAARVWHESRPTVTGYFRQMYRYGLWKVRYTLHTGDARLVDYSPAVAMIGSAALAYVSPWLFLIYPALCVAETVVVALLARPAQRLLPLMLLGWLVKNTGWGLGVLHALLQQVTGRSRIPAGPRPRVA
ncbi:glycosyltransferase family 2 protein [Actinoplanes sp. GCM10030250]|uniref:glycosyltransferase family 2 protein n=1 Tax=Actinoplanes sp. GCM10030250 TaxID=3273376 RepID=UPI0036120BC5